MSCILHSLGAKVEIDTGSPIMNESTRKSSYTERKMKGTVRHIDKENHKLTIHLPDLNETVIVAAKDAKKSD